jgi:hypothetical protein
MECLLAIARVKIAAAHRRNSVTARIPANPINVDLWSSIAIDAGGVSATGKVKRVVHSFNPGSGEAITEFTLAVSTCEGTEFVHTITDPAIPDGTSAGVGTEVDAVAITWNGLYGQDGILTITFPELFPDERSNADVQITAVYETDINENAFEVTL